MHEILTLILAHIALKYTCTRTQTYGTRQIRTFICDQIALTIVASKELMTR